MFFTVEFIRTVLIEFLIITLGSFFILCGCIFGLAWICTILNDGSIWKTSKNDDKHNSAMYMGRVSHTRYLPIQHSFGYPLWMCLLDLDESDALFGGGNGHDDSSSSDNGEEQSRTLPLLWPLTYFIDFDSQKDHLKNGEGLLLDTKNDKSSKNSNNCLKRRILRLVNERTEGKISELKTWLSNNENGDTTKLVDFKVCLLTHLRYYGYCFNPVSFYYVMMIRKDSSHNNDNSYETIAIVAEVSNTPWNEMHCYVLHPDSVDVQSVKPGRTMNTRTATSTTVVPSTATATTVVPSTATAACSDNDNNNNQSTVPFWKSTNYIFDKTFHVSPFMEMTHLYDWTLWDVSFPHGCDEIAISTTMIKKTQQQQQQQQQPSSNGEKQSTLDHINNSTTDSTKNNNDPKKNFNAFLRIQRTSMHPYRLAIFLIQYPIYCMLIQVWIHYEAFWLFCKGVTFVPHPNAAETKASRIIGTIMIPFFSFQDWYQRITIKSTCSRKESGARLSNEVDQTTTTKDHSSKIKIP